MIETEWAIHTPDGAKIYGVLLKARKAPSKKAVLIVNGLGCFYFYHPYSAAAAFFAEQGYDVIRFNFCDAREKARNILECTQQTLVADFRQVLETYKSSYDALYLAGHSYGGLIIMMANPDGVAATSLWDPSYNMADHSWAEGLTEDLPGDRILIRWGGAYVSSKKMWDGEKTIDKPYCRSLSAAARFPVQVIHAGQGILYSYGESWHSSCPYPTDYYLIENAGHCFEQLDSVPVLLDKCAAWFGQF